MLKNSVVRSQFDRYKRVSSWMLRDSFARFSWDMLTVLIASIVGVVMQGGVLGIILAYAMYLESGKTVEILGHSFAARSELAFFTIGAVSFVLLVLSAYLIFISKRKSAVLSVDYEEYCSRRILKQPATRPLRRIIEYNIRNMSRVISREQIANSVGCGRAIFTVMNSAFPVIIFLYMSVFLAYLNLEVTLVMMLLLIFFLVHHYRVNVFVVENEDRLLEVQPKSRQDLQGLFTVFESLNKSHPDMEDRIDTVYESENIKAAFDGIRNRRMSVARADLASNVMIAIVMSLVVVYLGYQALLGYTTWGELLVYLISFRLAVVGVRSVLNNIAAYARWYPRVRDYYEFMQSSNVATGFDTAMNHLTVDNRNRLGDVEQCILNPGDTLGLVTPVALNRFTLFYYIDELLCHTDASRMSVLNDIDFVSAQTYITENLTLREFLGLSREETWTNVKARFPKLRFIERLERKVDGDLDYELSGDMIRNKTGKRGTRISLLAAYLHPSKFLIVTDEVLASIGKNALQQWLELFSDRILIICYGDDFVNVGAYHEKAVVVGNAEGQSAVGTVDWIKDNEELLVEKSFSSESEDFAGEVDELEA